MAVPPDAGAALWSGTLRGANMTAAPEIRGRQKFLFAETQLRDQFLIATLVLLLEIGEEGAALVDHHQEAAAAVVVLVVRLEVVGPRIDAVGQDRDLDFRRKIGRASCRERVCQYV